MEANEILPAIPRQKVRHIPSGAVAEVMDKTNDGTVLCVRHNPPSGSYLSHWIVEDCEPVPEEPRPFRVGDKAVIYVSVVVEGHKKHYKLYSTIKTVTDTGYIDLGDGYDSLRRDCVIAHATPQECKEYFN
jgi:hypothetical protein